MTASGFFPLSLDLSGRPCVVVGGGPVGERKVDSLLKYGAAVTVISPRVTPGLSARGEAGDIRLCRREFRAGDLEGAVLAFAAAGREDVNEAVRADALAHGVLLNAVDDPSRCDFIVPAVMSRGDLTIAVATGGRSPALARRLRERLEGEFGPEYGVWLEILGEVRRKVLHLPERERRDFLFSLVDDPLYLDLLKEGDRAGVERRIKDRLEDLTT